MTAMATEEEAATSTTLKANFGDKEIVFRQPKHGELDLALTTRLMQQLYRHGLARDEVKGGPGSALAIDDILLKIEDCFEEIGRRIRGMLNACTLTFDGKAFEVADLPPMSDENMNEWSDMIASIYLKLMEIAAPGK